MKRLFLIFSVLVFVFSLISCTGPIHPADVPDDFSFTLEWGCCGDNTYDSKTGKLVKQKIATNVGDYTTTFFLSDEQKAEIFTLIRDMKPETYPDEYNPLRGGTDPSRNIVLSVTYGGKTKTITCTNVSLGNTPKGRMGKKFMRLHDKITDILKSSAEWQALPDYEFYYD